VDAWSGAGAETLVRLMLRTVGARFEPQVEVPGVGRVDVLVDGWLIVECRAAGAGARGESGGVDRASKAMRQPTRPILPAALTRHGGHRSPDALGSGQSRARTLA
jgi:hypothetical protein